MDKWNKRFMDITEHIATWSSCIRRHVGAVIVKDKRIMTTGYNGAPAGVETCKDRGECLRNKLNIQSGTHAELCYAPPYSGAKDPVNLIGMAIENVRQGLVKPYFGTDFSDMLVLDVRPANMYEQAHIHGAINIPAAQIRNRLGELPKDKPIMIHCVKGYTSYVVARILAQYGFENIFS